MSNKHRKTKSEIPNDKENELLSNFKLKNIHQSLDILSKISPRVKYDDDLGVGQYKERNALSNNFTKVKMLSSKEIETSCRNNNISDASPLMSPIENDSAQVSAVHSRSESNNDLIHGGNAKKGTQNNKSLKRASSKGLSELTKSIMKEEEDIPLEEELKFIADFICQETAVENEYQTAEYFRSTQLDEIVSCLLALIAVGSGIIYYEIKSSDVITDQNFKDSVMYGMLLVISINVFLFLISMIFKYINYMKLYKSANYIGSRDNFFQTDLWGFALFEFIFAVLHPNIYHHNVHFVTGKSWNLENVPYSVNDFLLIILLLRMFYIFRTIVICTKFYGDRADRVNKMMGNRLTMYFSLKCILLKYPIKILVITTLTVAFTLAFMIKIIEGPMWYVTDEKNNYNDYRKFYNCIWNMFVTMTTVGYGDYYPLTSIGRLIIVISSISGIILVSLVVIFLQNTTELNSDEEKVYEFVLRLESKDEIKQQAAAYFHRTFKYFLQKKKFLRVVKENKNLSEEEVEKMKKLLLNSLYKKIRTKKIFKGYLHHFQNNFGTPDDFETINKKIDDIESSMILFSNRTDELENKLQQILVQVYKNNK